MSSRLSYKADGSLMYRWLDLRSSLFFVVGLIVLICALVAIYRGDESGESAYLIFGGVFCFSFAYSAAAFAVNRTEMKLHSGKLQSVARPLPFPLMPKRVVEAGRIQFVHARTHFGDETSYEREIVLMLEDKSEVVFARGFKSEDELSAVASWIKEATGRPIVTSES